MKNTEAEMASDFWRVRCERFLAEARVCRETILVIHFTRGTVSVVHWIRRLIFFSQIYIKQLTL